MYQYALDTTKDNMLQVTKMQRECNASLAKTWQSVTH